MAKILGNKMTNCPACIAGVCSQHTAHFMVKGIHQKDCPRCSNGEDAEVLKNWEKNIEMWFPEPAWVEWKKYFRKLIQAVRNDQKLIDAKIAENARNGDEGVDIRDSILNQ